MICSNPNYSLENQPQYQNPLNESSYRSIQRMNRKLLIQLQKSGYKQNCKLVRILYNLIDNLTMVADIELNISANGSDTCLQM